MDKKELMNSEIDFIIKDSKHSKYLNNEIHLSNKKTDIIQISKNSGLILFYGNDETGFLHIQKFHAPNSLISEFDRKGITKTKTLFANELIPVFHYLNIADEIYKIENNNVVENKRPEIFDIYIGVSNVYRDNVKYKLILYKGTKIIHNLHPMTKTTQVNLNTTKFVRGVILYNVFFADEIAYIVTVPYHDSRLTIVFKIVFEYMNGVRKVIIYKTLNDEIIQYKTVETQKTDFVPTNLYAANLQFKDLKVYEKYFKDFE